MESKITDEGLEKILRLIGRQDFYKTLSDKELSSLVLEKIWGKKLVFGSDEDFLLDEYITRFEGLAGIKRDCDGDIVN